jgi:nucleoid DNA-binding protein
MANKADIVQKMHDLGDITKSQAEKMLDLVLLAKMEVFGDMAKKEPNKKRICDKLTIVGFGTYDVKAVPERVHRNPQKLTEKAIKPAHNTVKFSPGSMALELMNE